MKPIKIVHLYPVEMSIYGDRGNVLALSKRLEWRGIESQVVSVGIGDKFDLLSADIIFAGGGQDRGQISVGRDLQVRAHELHRAAEEGVVMLTICGTYQLFGRRFLTLNEQEIPGIGLFAAETIGSRHRMIGNIAVESQFGQLVGFENHSGETILDARQKPIGRVTKGFGNNTSSGYEGAIKNNAYGTYLHGPILPKNPVFADHLLAKALKRRGIGSLQPLDDAFELRAAKSAASRPQ